MLGSIHLVSLKDFMIYEKKTFRPRDGLNLFIGLGGELTDIGRQKTLAAFVREDSNGPAVIEISLNWHSGGKQKFKTVIDKKSPQKPQYFINEEDVDRDQVVTMAKNANINPSNMCQFLPQEKVSQFSRMDHKLLFLNVLKAIGSEEALEAYQNLGDKENRFQARQTRIEAHDDNMEAKQAELGRMKHVVDNFNEREDARKKKDALEALLNITKLKKAAAERMEAHGNQEQLSKTL